MRKLILICLTITAMTGYAAVIGAQHPGGFVLRIVGEGRISLHTARYLERFGASALLLGIIPFTGAMVLGVSRAALGLRQPQRYGSMPWIALFVAVGVLVGVFGLFDSSLVAFYPYHPELGDLVSEYGVWVFFLHAFLYFLFYYVPWELTFRGVMVVTVTELPAAESKSIPPVFYLVALLQAAPSAILHFHHPLSEVFGAVFFGFVAGYITLVSRSILPSLLIHATAGIALDGLILLKAAG